MSDISTVFTYLQYLVMEVVNMRPCWISRVLFIGCAQRRLRIGFLCGSIWNCSHHMLSTALLTIWS